MRHQHQIQVLHAAVPPQGCSPSARCWSRHPSVRQPVRSRRTDAPVILLPGAKGAEGIAAGEDNTFFAGDLVTGDIFRGDIHKGNATRSSSTRLTAGWRWA